MRIDKYLSNLKYGSRTEIKKLIKDKKVIVNNEVIKNNDFKIDLKNDSVLIDGKVIPYFEELNLVLNKPSGYLSANKDNLHKTVIDLIDEPFNRYDLKISGRLDLDTEGLLVLTTSGEFAHEITSPNSNILKTYEVLIDKDCNDFTELEKGVIIKDGKGNEYLAKAIAISRLGFCKIKIVIDEGKFHQVKRMFEKIGYTVIGLKRVKIGNLELGDLKIGEYRIFKREELLWQIYYC